jgi:hypothetical protein
VAEDAAASRPDLSGTTKTETETTSSGRGDPRDFGFVAEDAAASRPDLSGTTKTETETTSSGRGDPRDFGFVAEDAAASRPGMTTGTPLDISGGILSVLPPVTTTTPPEGRGTRIGDRTFVLTDDGLVLDAQTGAAASSDMATAVREKLNPSLTLDDIIGGQSQYDPTGGGVNPSYVEDGTRGTSTTSSGRGDPRDFGFVAASRPGRRAPRDISAGF